MGILIFETFVALVNLFFTEALDSRSSFWKLQRRLLPCHSLHIPPPRCSSHEVLQMCTSFPCRQSGQAEMLLAGQEETGELHPPWSPAAREHLLLPPVWGRGEGTGDNKHFCFPVCLTHCKTRHLVMPGRVPPQEGSQHKSDSSGVPLLSPSRSPGCLPALDLGRQRAVCQSPLTLRAALRWKRRMKE